MSAVPATPLLIGTVAAVGVLHTLVPDHWAPIALLARQRGWSRAQTARTAAIAGIGHVLSTLAIALVVWIAGAALAARYGRMLSAISSIGLVGFGLWIAIGAWRELRAEGGGHAHDRPHQGGTSQRTALLLVLGSSPMVEGIPTFFAAAPSGPAVLAAMALIFAVSTIGTYVVLCVASASGLARAKLGPLERYGEVLSGGIVAALGLVFGRLSG